MKSTHHTLSKGSRDCTSHTTMKDKNKGYYTKAKKASELHDLLSCHHRADRKGVHMPVGDISEVEG